MASSKLTALQKEFLDSFFSREQRFLLTGGAALAGFYLGHRETDDLDEGFALISEIARDSGTPIESLQTAPDFRRLLMRRGSEDVVIDLVRDRVAQMVSEKPVVGGICIDPPEEILANKLCALLSRSEIRDLVDVRALEMAGYAIEDTLEAARLKDTGLTAAQLGWVLSQIKMGDDLIAPGGVSVEELRRYLDDLIARLSRMAFPE